jgi:hypothetical protein
MTEFKMKFLLGFLILATAYPLSAQVWKTLPKGVRIAGYRNVTTSKISSNFNQFRSESPLGGQFRLDGPTINEAMGGNYVPDELLVGTYKIDAEAQFNVHGTGFGYGITDRVMFYGEIAYYNAQVKARLKRTANNNYKNVSRNTDNEFYEENLNNFFDVRLENIQKIIVEDQGYKPIGDWYGSGFGDMETGFMIKAIDRGVWGLQIYPGVILPTGREDDPDILQDVGFGDGQFDVFGEIATGYVVNDHLSFGTNLRYTYQTPTTKTLRVPESRDVTLSSQKGEFDVKYGDRLNLNLSSTISLNDWIAFTPIYRYMYQMPSEYDSDFGKANDYLSYNSDKQEHTAQLTTTISSIQPFLKKEFLLPAQINVNVLKTLTGKNVPAASRFEVEFRMLF